MPASGQGIRIRIEIEETNTGKTSRIVDFLSLPTTNLEVDFREILNRLKGEMQMEFEYNFLQDLKNRYKENNNASN